MAQGEHIGTELKATHDPMQARNQWIADHLRCVGKVVLDEGAADALVARKTSLLPVGIKSVEGEFVRGEVVACCAPDGREIARGLANYSSSEIQLIKGRHTEDVEPVLGYCTQPEFIHRDNLVMTL